MSVLKINTYELVETSILAVTGIFSLILLGLSIYAYRESKLKKILFASTAFALFGIQLLIEALGENFEFLDTELVSVVSALTTLGVLVFFFLAIVKKKN